jgi:hypothetical protein
MIGAPSKKFSVRRSALSIPAGVTNMVPSSA